MNLHVSEAQVWKLLLRWGNPYTKPPAGQPEVLAEASIMQPKGKGAPVEWEWPEDFRAQVARSRPGDGYALHLSVDLAGVQHKAWPQERKWAVRRGNLRKRIAKQVGPLFAHRIDELVAVEVASRPDYFGRTADTQGAFAKQPANVRPAARM